MWSVMWHCCPSFHMWCVMVFVSEKFNTTIQWHWHDIMLYVASLWCHSTWNSTWQTWQREETGDMRHKNAKQHRTSQHLIFTLWHFVQMWLTTVLQQDIFMFSFHVLHHNVMHHATLSCGVLCCIVLCHIICHFTVALHGFRMNSQNNVVWT